MATIEIEAREAIARALVLHEYGDGSWEAFDEREREAWREQVDTYLKLDPLRQKLGRIAVATILAVNPGEVALVTVAPEGRLTESNPGLANVHDMGNTDPLRDKLGHRAVEALLAGEAAVLELDGNDCKLLGEGTMNERWVVIKASKLDTMFRRLDTGEAA